MKAQNASLVMPGRTAPAVDAPVLAQPLNRSKPTMPLLKIYIVEDSVVIRDNLIATLEEMAPVTVVGSAVDEASALAWLCPGEAAYDLVIIDIFLRQGSGLGVLKQLRPLRPEASLVVLTNYATPDMRSRCLALGADRVFDKSHEIDALLDYCSGLASAAR
ncbi:response regulator transcription factor [Roseateles toxinivorans]|uniref:Response regulator receiver domain-containing protein n=1 Tax=Roseateles toxinivorans TaxID=270368 RepID=A0A4R6QLH9_9BURK|nr:response regulator receiver domain-containing protein [Roseateles toxinivorans]